MIHYIFIYFIYFFVLTDIEKIIIHHIKQHFCCFRFDVGRLDRKFLNKTFTLQNGAISVLFYFMGLIFSLSIANMDDKIWLLDEDPSLWEDDKVYVKILEI